ncbi:hypothetical protein [Psychromonas sp. SP041]|uniref:hypothetical protein n=1 Tax=Psychromonas sp. SP041 TaxID=1365007 RepID=UPI0010C7C3D8|nr:hypothetical protein [Psychromonas sp. SP041]
MESIKHNNNNKVLMGMLMSLCAVGPAFGANVAKEIVLNTKLTDTNSTASFSGVFNSLIDVNDYSGRMVLEVDSRYSLDKDTVSVSDDEDNVISTSISIEESQMLPGTYDSYNVIEISYMGSKVLGNLTISYQVCLNKTGECLPEATHYFLNKKYDEKENIDESILEFNE